MDGISEYEGILPSDQVMLYSTVDYKKGEVWWVWPTHMNPLGAESFLQLVAKAKDGCGHLGKTWGWPLAAESNPQLAAIKKTETLILQPQGTRFYLQPEMSFKVDSSPEPSDNSSA